MKKKIYLRTTRNLYAIEENGLKVFYSYSTPVAFQYKGALYISENVWSVTTAKHLNWIEDYCNVTRKKHRWNNAIFEERLAEYMQLRQFNKAAPEPVDNLKVVSGVAAAFGLLADNKEQKNKFQKRFFETIPGISFPQDWDQLPEEEKEKRLAAVIKAGRNA
tara:strand:+ start:2555 stop:3040 length:486 start_codon:yes stop_codon:yes gene_type:complete